MVLPAHVSTWHALHPNEIDVGLFCNVVDGDHVRVFQHTSRLRFLDKPALPFRVGDRTIGTVASSEPAEP